MASSIVVLVGGPASGSTTLTGPLHTTGNQILDASNQPVRLRGLTRVVTRTKTATEDEIDHIRQWGANAVRLTMDEDEWNQLCVTTSYDPNYKSDIDNVVNWVTSRGMVAVLELASNPRFTCDPQAASNKKMADYPGSILFWQSVARHYEANPLVAFELYNEPHDITEPVWRNGGTMRDGLVTWAAAGMQQMYNAVRAAGADNLVFVGGLNWSNEPPTDLVNGYNIVYGAHMYTCPHNPPPKCTYPEKVGPMGLVTVNLPVPNPYDPTPYFDKWTPLSKTNPVAVTEFGWPSASDGTYNAAVIAAAESRGWSWMGYAWFGSPNGTFNLLLDTGPNFAPNASGVPVKNGLALNP